MPAGYGYAGSGNAKPKKKTKTSGSSVPSSDAYMNPSKAPKQLEKKAKKRSF
jgi:hypothetical protein